VRLSAIAIAVVALSAFLPWASVLGFTKSGIRGDGVITMLLAVVGGLILALSTGLVGRERAPGKKSMIALLVLAALVAVIAVADMNGVAAIGLYLRLFAGIAWVVGAIWELNARRSGGTSVAAPGEDHRPVDAGAAPVRSGRCSHSRIQIHGSSAELREGEVLLGAARTIAVRARGRRTDRTGAHRKWRLSADEAARRFPDRWA